MGAKPSKGAGWAIASERTEAIHSVHVQAAFPERLSSSREEAIPPAAMRKVLRREVARKALATDCLPHKDPSSTLCRLLHDIFESDALLIRMEGPPMLHSSTLHIYSME